VVADQKVLASDDTRDVGASSTKPNTPSLIRSDIPEKSKPTTANRVHFVPPALAGVAESAHLLLLSGPIRFLLLIR
jgi:hypothetical protein